MIVVFWMETNFSAGHETFSDIQLMDALKKAENLRKEGFTHVNISSELGNSVGKPGVDTVADGKTPDGEDYEWSKQYRGNPHLRF